MPAVQGCGGAGPDAGGPRGDGRSHEGALGGGRVWSLRAAAPVDLRCVSDLYKYHVHVYIHICVDTYVYTYIDIHVLGREREREKGRQRDRDRDRERHRDRDRQYLGVRASAGPKPFGSCFSYQGFETKEGEAPGA